MSTTVSNIVIAANNLNYIAMIFIRCYSFIFIPIGTIGHLMSIYVFTRPTLRTNPCSRYFLAATIIGLASTCYNLPVRVIQSGFVDTDPGAYSVVFCKVVWLSLYSIRGISGWLIALACADRYFCSCQSANKRAWSSVRVANRAIPLTILLGVMAYIHVPIFFRIDMNPATQKYICYPPGPPGTYRIVLSYFQLVYLGLAPSFFMLLFGLLTIRNMKRSKRRLVMPVINGETAMNQSNRRNNRNMLRMLFLQVLVYCVTGLTFSVAMIYTSINASRTKTIYEVAQENMINAVVGMLSNTGPCTSFYLFTLSSSLFRNELKNLFHLCNRNGNRSQQIENQTLKTSRLQTAKKAIQL